MLPFFAPCQGSPAPQTGKQPLGAKNGPCKQKEEQMASDITGIVKSVYLERCGQGSAININRKRYDNAKGKRKYTYYDHGAPCGSNRRDPGIRNEKD